MSAAHGPKLAFADDFGSVCLLLLLHERPSSRPELVARLRELGLATEAEPDLDSRLRELEWEGLIIATDAVGEGADDRLFHLTSRAMTELGSAAHDLRSTHLLLGRFLSRCGEQLVY